jgi:hypothetical protein
MPFLKEAPIVAKQTWASCLKGIGPDVFWNAYYTGQSGQIRYHPDRHSTTDFMREHMAPGILAGGYIPIYTPNPYLPGSSFSHWARGFETRFVMTPEGMNTKFRNNDITPLALKDMGWEVSDGIVHEVEIHFKRTTLAKSLSLNKAAFWNFGSAPETITRMEAVSPAPGTFGIVSGGCEAGPTELPPCSKHEVTIEYTRSTTGMDWGYLWIEYSGATTGTAVTKLYGLTDATDTDNDGISDENETRDLDSVTPGVQNPFSPEVYDSAQDLQNLSPDGLSDGSNDHDGDGFTNQEEFLRGTNPLDPLSKPTSIIEDGISQPVTITNPLAWPVSLKNFTLAGPGAPSYFITSGDTPRDISPGGETKVWVAFKPVVEGPQSATLQISYFSGNEDKTKDITISGTNVIE